MNLEDYLHDQIDFSTKTFGVGTRSKGIVEHIRKELEEIEADPSDLMEWVDVITLALDGAWRSGHSPMEICVALERKLAINKRRRWPPITDEDKAYTHIKEETNDQR